MAFAFFVSLFLFAFLSAVAYETAGETMDSGTFLLLEAFAIAASFWVFRRMTRKDRVRVALKSRPFAPEWEAVLNEYVPYYAALDDVQKKQFRYEIQCFIAEKRISGIKTQIDDTDRVLVAASAVIPIFGFPEWEYTNLKEVLLYPGSFGHDFATEGRDRNILGMVGTGYMNGMMILSQAQLRSDFRNATDKHNTAIHEFVHLVDKSDGLIDGLPQTLLDKQYTLPWLEMIREEMKAIKKGKSDINPYASFSKEEFFAVTSEYFFERPDLMKEKHPELYALLSRIFKQDNRLRFSKLLKRIFTGPKKQFGRNSPCPCGSGLKFKKCCGIADPAQKAIPANHL